QRAGSAQCRNSTRREQQPIVQHRAATNLKAQEPSMRARLEMFSGWCGLLIVLGGYGSAMLGMLNEPFYIFWLLVAGVVLSAWNFYSAMTDFESGPAGVPSPLAVRKYRRSLRERTVAASAFALTATAFIGIVLVEGWGTFAIASFEEQEVVPTLLQ